MKKKKRLAAAMAEALEIPQDIAVNQLKLTLRGKTALYLENHQGIVNYSPGRILCQTEEGLLEIRGRDLLLESLEADELLIQGEIAGISFSYSED